MIAYDLFPSGCSELAPTFVKLFKLFILASSSQVLNLVRDSLRTVYSPLKICLFSVYAVYTLLIWIWWLNNLKKFSWNLTRKYEQIKNKRQGYVHGMSVKFWLRVEKNARNFEKHIKQDPHETLSKQMYPRK